MSNAAKIAIVPAVLPKSFDELALSLERIRGISSFVQIDLVGSNVLAGHATSFASGFFIEFDIMLADPASEIGTLLMFGPSRVVVHAQASSAAAALKLLQQKRQQKIVEVGIALAAHDSPVALAPFQNLYDYVQVMGIDHIGKQGEPPDPHHREIILIKELRVQYPDLTIQVDGAAAAHASELVAAGANRLVVGSAIVGAQDPKAAFEALYNEVNAH